MTLPGEELARSAARAAARWDVDPNLVSLVSLLSAAAAGAAFWLDHSLLAAPLIALSGYLDLVDGELARRYGRSTRLGDFLDHTFDRLGDAAIFVGLGLGPGVPLSLGIAAALSTVLVAYVGTGAQAIGLDRVYGGLARRSNVMILTVLAAVATPLHPDALLYLAYVVIALSALTFLQRFIAVWKELR